MIEKSRKTGMNVQVIVGDKAHSEKKNIKYANENHLKLVVKLNSSITQGRRNKEDEFEYNKNAGMYICKAGHMSYRKIYQNRDKEKKNPRVLYDFNIEKCKACQYRADCYKDGATRKTYSKKVMLNIHSKQQ